MGYQRAGKPATPPCTWVSHLNAIQRTVYPITPISSSSAVKNLEMVAWLLDHGADPNRQCSIDLTPLSYAVADAPTHIIQTLLKCGGDVQKGELLQHAIDRQADVVEVLTLLIQNGAPLDRTMYQNHHWSWRLFLVSGLGTPLHTAANRGNMDAVRFLFSQGGRH